MDLVDGLRSEIPARTSRVLRGLFTVRRPFFTFLHYSKHLPELSQILNDDWKAGKTSVGYREGLQPKVYCFAVYAELGSDYRILGQKP